jgi:hypothetical protein
MSIGNGKKWKKKRISILDWSLKKMKYVTKIFIFKFWNFHFWNLKWKFLFNFFKKNWSYITKWKWKNNWNEEIIYFFYATEIKLPIIPLYHPYHLCIPPYTTCASCGGIQLISESLYFFTLLDAPIKFSSKHCLLNMLFHLTQGMLFIDYEVSDRHWLIWQCNGTYMTYYSCIYLFHLRCAMSPCPFVSANLNTNKMTECCCHKYRL